MVHDDTMEMISYISPTPVRAVPQTLGWAPVFVLNSTKDIF